AQIGVLPALADLIGHVAWSPDGSLLAVASFDGYVHIWNPASGVVQQRIGGDFTNGIEWVDWSPDGERIVWGDGYGNAEIYRVSDGGFLRGLYGRSVNRNNRVAWSP